MKRRALYALLIAVANCFVAGCMTAKTLLTPETLARQRTILYCHYHSELKDVAVRQDPGNSDLYGAYASLAEGLYRREEPIMRHLLSCAPDRILIERGRFPAVDPDFSRGKDLDDNSALIQEYRQACARNAKVRDDLGEEKMKLCIKMWNNARKTEEGEMAEAALRVGMNALADDVERWISRYRPKSDRTRFPN
jgi:hypothetical protein